MRATAAKRLQWNSVKYIDLATTIFGFIKRCVTTGFPKTAAEQAL